MSKLKCIVSKTYWDLRYDVSETWKQTWHENWKYTGGHKSRHILLKTLYKKRFLIFQKLSLVSLISASARHKDRTFTTIAKNQWVLRWSLPLMEWYLLNHWYQWFFNGFPVSLPLPMALVKMFFNGCQPLVERCDGNNTSFRSTGTVSNRINSGASGGWLVREKEEPGERSWSGSGRAGAELTEIKLD